LVAQVRERLSLSKLGKKKFDKERFDLENLNDVEFKKKE
jgi:hypothetical protein